MPTKSLRDVAIFDSEKKEQLLPVDVLIPWEQNPRDISIQEYNELKASLIKHGDLSPLLVNSGEKWGEAGMTMGGNIRLAIKKELGLKTAWVKIVDPKDEAEFLELSIKHNGHYGIWNPDKL